MENLKIQFFHEIQKENENANKYKAKRKNNKLKLVNQNIFTKLF